MSHDESRDVETPEAKTDSERFLQDVGQIVARETGEIEAVIVEIAAQDREAGVEGAVALAQVQQSKAGSFYGDLLYTLANIRYPEDEARQMWDELLSHKWNMSERVGRNIGIRVAALDYFTNVLNRMDNVRIIDHAEYIETAALAITDGLTSVFNHRYFQERLERDMQRAVEGQTPLSLCMFDVDSFKLYNDINGHMAGDVALREVARVLRESVKQDDLVARYGGEEFCLILYGVTKNEAVKIADRVRAGFEAVDFPNESVLPGGELTVSAGVAAFPADARDPSGLIRAADQALYRAKHAGRNRVCT